MPQEHEAPSRSAGLTLESDKMRSSLEGMAKYETGWEVVGGKRQRADMRGGEVNFTPWIPKAEWWRHRPVKMNEDQTKDAVRKALAGEELTKNQKRMVDYMVDVSNERMAEVDELGQQEWNAITADLKDTGLEPTTRDVVDTDLTAKAAAIDERAVENAAVRYENDDAAFMAEIQRIIDEANPDAAAAGSGEKGSGKAPAGGSTPDAAAGSPNQAGEGKPGAEGEKAGADPLAAAAERYVLEEPTRLLRVGTNADGTPDYRTAQQYLEEARADAAQAREDSKLFEIAANCLLGGGR